MKYLTYFFAFLFVVNSMAQNQQRPQPESWQISTIEKVSPILLDEPDLTQLRAEDAINDTNKSIPWRFGYDHYVNFGLTNSGKWHTLDNGDRIWRVNIVSPKAISMNLIFNQYNIPQGGKIYIYNDDHSEILNVFTEQHNNPEEILGTWLVSGESIWIEYLEPEKVKNQGRLNIGNVIHGYRKFGTANSNEDNQRALNDSGACNVDVNCDITSTSALGNSIKDDVKKSVGMIVVGGNGGCSGALINNTNNDGTPYFLTANHCLGGSVAGWAFRFNWASDASVADCATTAPSIDNGFIQTASGGILRASNSESDMALVEITDTAFFNSNPDVVWAGWNRSKTAVPSLNIGIHHPSGDIQKVCLDFQGATRQTTGFNGNPTTEVWRIADWDLGVTEPGSSGSPLFDQDGLIIGKLSGGSAACTGVNGSGTTDNGGFDIYGRFGVSWDFSAVNSEQLQFWLDPNGTNPTTLSQFPSAQEFNLDASINVLNIPDTLCEESITPTLRLTNNGTTTLTSATIRHRLDLEPRITINWTGTLAKDEFEDIILDPITVSVVGAHSFSASVVSPNGNNDEFEGNNSSAKNFIIPEIVQTSVIRVVITPDRYGAETTWTLRDSQNNLVANGGPFTTVATNGTQPEETENVTITTFNECYTFTINDSFDDGICCAFGNGTYRLEDSDNNIIIDGDGDFGTSSSSIFKINQLLGTDNNAFNNDLKIYPNPSKNNFTVDVNRFSNITYNIVNMLGQKIRTGLFNNGINNLNMENEASGLYFIQLTDTETNISTTKKIIKQ